MQGALEGLHLALSGDFGAVFRPAEIERIHRDFFLRSNARQLEVQFLPFKHGEEIIEKPYAVGGLQIDNGKGRVTVVVDRDAGGKVSLLRHVVARAGARLGDMGGESEIRILQ